jgi:cell division septum initiation protein DivIVA
MEQLLAEHERLRAEVERLRTDLMESDEIREKLRHLLTRTAAALKGDPPAGVWHSWHDLPELAAQLAEALERGAWDPRAAGTRLPLFVISHSK